MQDQVAQVNTSLRSGANEMRIVAGTVFLVLLVFSSTAVAQNNPVPFINLPSEPVAVVPGTTGLSLTINGTGFVSGSVVNWNGNPLATTFVSPSELTATVTSADSATAGTALVTVANPRPGGGESNPIFFTVANPVAVPSFTFLPANESFAIAGSILSADLNGDGKLDLAYLVSTQTGSPSSVIIQLGKGDGSFQSPVSYPVGKVPQSLIVSDFNGDGKPDLALANTQDNTVSILLGKGDGTFQPGSTLPVLNAPEVLIAGDFNGDGKLDIVAGYRFQDTGDVGGISVLLGNGDGTFTHLVDYQAGFLVFGLAVGDFNRDGKLDLIVAAESPQVGIVLTFLEGKGDGTFQASPAITPSANLEALAAADLNGDGRLDLITADLGGGAFVELGNGDGTFQPPVEYGSGRSSIGLVLGDFNADGKLDVLLSNQDQNSISILPGNGDGTFQNPIDFPAKSSTLSVAAGDFNGDGRMDVAAITAGAGAGPSAAQVILQDNLPVATVTPSSLTFAQQALNTTSFAQTVTVTNTGAAALSLSSITITGADASDFAQTDNCSRTLAVAGTCQINVTFTPTAGGSRNAVVSINDDAPGSPQMVSLAGSAPGTVVASLAPTSIAFPNQFVGTSGLPQTVTLTNSGTIMLSIASVNVSSADFGMVNTCGNSLSAGSSCSIAVFFDPTTAGARTGALTVTDNASDSPQTISLTGTGQDFSLAPTSSSTATIVAGQTANYTVGVAPAGGFSQQVALTCSGAPALSMCAVSPSSVVLNGASIASVAVTLTTTAPSHGFLLPFAVRSSRVKTGSIVICWLSFVLVALASLRRWLEHQNQAFTWIQAIAFVMLLSVGLTLTSCSSGTGGGNPSTPPGNYTISISGVFSSGSSALTRGTNLTLVVK
jgi:hypothetical protein